MNDQADALRSKMKRPEIRQTDKKTKVIAVVSGKGGVGKSNFTVNFSLGLQRTGRKVLIIDLDIGMANIDILLGRTSSNSIVDMIYREMSIWSVIEKGPEGLSYIAGGSGLAEVFEMNESKADYFFRQIRSLESQFDYVIFDMGAGITSNSFYFLLSSHDIFLVTTPEPTAVTDAYGMMKYIHFHDSTIPLKMVINRARSKRDGSHTAENLRRVAKQFLAKEVDDLAVIPDDQIVWKAVRTQRPFILSAPDSKPAYAIQSAADRYVKGHSRDFTEQSSIQSFLSKLKSFIKH